MNNQKHAELARLEALNNEHLLTIERLRHELETHKSGLINMNDNTEETERIIKL
jgi:hypothetical protein